MACGKGGSRDSSEGVLWDPRNFSKNEKQHCFPSNFTLIDRRFYEAVVLSSCIKKEIRYIALADDFPNSQPLFLGAQQSDFCSVLCLWVETAKRRPMAYLYGPKMGWPSSTACFGLLVNPRIRPNLQTILHQWSGVLSRYQSWFLNFVFQLGPLKASRIPPLPLPFGARLGSWLHLTPTHFDFFLICFSPGLHHIGGSSEHLPTLHRLTLLIRESLVR